VCMHDSIESLGFWLLQSSARGELPQVAGEPSVTAAEHYLEALRSGTWQCPRSICVYCLISCLT